MPPCLKTEYEGSGINYTRNIHGVIDLNGTNTMETSTVADDSYDEVGAMQFIIVTVSVYSFLGVFFLLVIRFRQSTTSHKSARSQADSINNYLKMEKTLKLEGYKMKMLKEIEKHVESIDLFEQRMKLLEIRKDLETKDFGLRKDLKSKDSRNKKAVRKKFQSSSRRQLGKKRLSAPDAFGRIGFSVLFMEPREETLQEEDEDMDENVKSVEIPQKSILSATFPFKDSQPETYESGPETGKEFADIQYIDS